MVVMFGGPHVFDHVVYLKRGARCSNMVAHKVAGENGMKTDFFIKVFLNVFISSMICSEALCSCSMQCGNTNRIWMKR